MRGAFPGGSRAAVPVGGAHLPPHAVRHHGPVHLVVRGEGQSAADRLPREQGRAGADGGPVGVDHRVQQQQEAPADGQRVPRPRGAVQAGAGAAAGEVPRGARAARRVGGAGGGAEGGDGRRGVPPRAARGVGVPAMPGVQGGVGASRLREGGSVAVSEPCVAA